MSIKSKQKEVISFPFILSLLTLAFISVGYRLPQNLSTEEIVNAKNIYLKDSLLLVSDGTNGIGIYSVLNPTNPIKKGHIYLHGHSGLAVRNNVIYANSYNRILALRLNDDFSCDTLCSIGEFYPHYMGDMYCGTGLVGCCSSPISAEMGSGTGGSYAVFAVVDSFLYYINEGSLKTMDISNSDTIKELSNIYVDFSIETLFPRKGHLFIGGRRGMYLFSLSNPSRPTRIGTLNHFQAHDPVVVQDTIAYVTLRKGSFNNNSRDALLIVNIANLEDPKVITELSTYSPYGLVVKDTFLFVSNGYNGMTLFSVADPRNPTTLFYKRDIETKDFIWSNNLLYMMGFSNVILFDAIDPKKIKELSYIY